MYNRETIRPTLRHSTIRQTILQDGDGVVIPPLALLDRFGNPIKDRSGAFILTRTLPTTWTYATLAIAEASSIGGGGDDDWQEGDTIQITGGATFIYRQALADKGYSGIIHLHQWDGTGVLGSMGAIDLKAITEKNIDPDSWTDFSITKAGSGTADINGDRSRLFAGAVIGASNWCRATESGGLAAGDNESFAIFDNLTAGFTDTGASNNSIRCILRLLSADDGANTSYITLQREWNSGNWKLDHGTGASSTTKSTATEARVWLYVKENRWALWFDAEATPALSGIFPDSGADLSTVGLMEAKNVIYIHSTFIKLTQALIGNMETV